ncbi:MAG: helix-turn-helix transcriptional regulator, partial [Oscillospiraceae bacterium]|nr:helix-turn-helix transcriptional regulator [Oscillospiraceae bacterium]
ALVAGDDLASFLMQSDEYKSDLAYFAIYNVAAEIVEAHGFGVSVQDVDERTVLIFFGEENIEEEVLRVAEEIHDSILKFLKIRCTISIGRPVRRLQELSRSFQDARHTLEYRFVLGGDQVIYAQNLPKNQDLVSADMPRHVRGICRAVRSGGEKEVEDEIDCFITNIRQSCLSRNRSIFHIQNLILNVMKELDAAALDETEIFRQERELLNKVYDKDRLSEIKTELTSFCMELARSFRDEKDSYCKSQAIRALDYIEEHYREDVTLNSVCSYLAMSTSYFSSIFKTYTGLTFIEALTRKRIEKAKTLLENTSRKAYEIAWEVGYSDPHYFSSTFKRMTGMSPTEYAKKVR